MSLSESRHGWAFPRLLIHLPQISTSFVLKPSHLWSHWEQYAGRLDHYAFGILICEVSCPAVVVVGFQGREQTASSVWTWSFGVSGFGIGLRRSVWSIYLNGPKNVFLLCVFCRLFFQSTVLRWRLNPTEFTCTHKGDVLTREGSLLQI